MEGREIQQLYEELATIRESASWQRKLTAASYLHHRDSYRYTRVEKRDTYDSCTVSYMSTFVNGILGNLVPREQKWFQFTPAGIVKSDGGKGKAKLYTRYKDLDEDSKLYGILETVTDLVAIALQQSNFYEVVSMFLQDAAIMGTGFVLVVDEWGHRRKLRTVNSTFKLRFQVVDPQECVVAEDAHGQVDTYVRRYFLPEKKVEDRFGVKARDHWKSETPIGSGFLRDVEVYEAVVPGDGNRDGFRYMVYIPSLEKTVEDLELEYFPLFRYAMNRDSDATPYGMGLAPKFLDDVVILDEYGKAALKMGQRAGSPPLIVSNTLKDDFSATPSALVASFSETDRATRIFDSENPSVLLAMQQDARECIRREFYADLFSAIMQSSDTRRTAYEISETVKQANSLLKEHVYSFLDQFLSPLLTYVANVVVEQARYIGGDFDGKLSGVRKQILPNTAIAFNSVFMRMLDDVMRTEGITQTLSLAVNLVQVQPSILSNFDVDGMVRQAAVGMGLDTRLLVDLAQVQKAKKASQEQNDRRISAETGQMEASANLDAAKAQQILAGGSVNGQG